MKRYRPLLVNAALLMIGVLLGASISRYCILLEEFPRVMALRLVISETFKTMPANAGLQWFGTTGFNWNQELINIELQRYILSTAERQTNLADNALKGAAILRRNRAPSAEDI